MKRNTLLISLFSILAIALVAYFFLQKKNIKKFSWEETYNAESEHPYGTLFIRQLLESYREGEQFIYNENKPLAEVLIDSLETPADYIFVGSELNLSEADQEELRRFIFSGNDALIAVQYLPFGLIEPIISVSCDNEIYLDSHFMESATFNFYHPSLQKEKGYTYTIKFRSYEKKEYQWTALQPDAVCDSATTITPLGYFAESINFFMIPYGDGRIYIHTNPIAFTNFFMRSSDKAEYAAGVFSHLRGRTLIRDEYSRSQFVTDSPESNPLAFIMEQESLRYAWWLMLFTAILYTFFTAKRRQRVIPVREEKTNTSLEYVKMVSALHYENGDHKDIALKKMKYFLYYVKANYGIYTTKFTGEHFKRLSEKSHIGIGQIEHIFRQYGQIEKTPASSFGAHELMVFCQDIDRFYKYCK